MSKIVKCPTCSKDVKWEIGSQWRPFCSERCRLIDLGEWASESHRIEGDETLPQELLEQQKHNHH